MASRRQLGRDIVGSCAAIGFGIGGGIGAVVGLVIGVIVHPATAWFAVIELGLPGAVVGLLLGAAVGVVLALARRTRTTRA